MSKVVLNEAQKQFVELFDKNVLVSASAGSGKTTTMITKIIKVVVEKRIPLKNILIVTYTNSAGSELKLKLYNKLLEEINNSSDESLINFLAEQLESINTSDIGTLHSVCKKIIKKYFYVIEQDSNFVLLNESDSSYYFNQATNKVFKELIANNDESFYEIYSSFNVKRSTALLSEIVEKIYNFLCSKQNKQQWINYVYNQVYNLNLEENVCVKYLVNKFKRIFCSQVKEFEKFYNRSQRLNEKIKQYIECRFNFCKQMQYVNSYKEFASLLDYSFLSKPRTSKSTTVEEYEFLDDCELLINDFANALKGAREIELLYNEEQLKTVKHLISNLFDVVKLVKEEYEKIKKEKYVIDFNDLEDKTLKILDNQQICAELKSKYKYIFVDEYQDINEIQESIINKLSSDDNCNMIGDVKQSIYEFRLSNPKLFLEKYKAYGKDNGGVLINLNENYRSEENILQFVNFIFNNLITEQTLGINYKKHSQLIKGGQPSGNKVVSMDVVDIKKESLEGEELNDELINDDIESLLIAKKVVHLLGKEYSVNGEKHIIEYKDIAILLRSKTQLAQKVYKQLKALNIPCSVTFKSDIFKSTEIMQLVSVLKVLNNHHNDVAYATFLKSPIINLSEAQLMQIRLIDEKLKFFECANTYIEKGQDHEIKNKLNIANDFLIKYRFYLQDHSILETLEEIMLSYNLNEYYFSLPDGFEKERNILHLKSIIDNSDFKHNLIKCLDFLDDYSKHREVVMESEVQGFNAVKIITMHSSKGLEYPAVIVGGLGKNFLINRFTSNLIINDKFGVGIKYLNRKTRVENETLVRLACRYANEKGNIDEEMRLLYVALTRAKNFLCLTGCYDFKNVISKKNKDIYACRTYLDFIFKSFPNSKLNLLKNGESVTLNKGEDNQFSVNIHKKADFESFDESNSVIFFNKGDESAIKTLQKCFNFKYPYSLKSNVAIKNSVSSILKEETDYENLVYAPKKLELFETNQSADALKVGTLYHYIMEKINYDESEDEINQIIENILLIPEYTQLKQFLNKNEIFEAVKNINCLRQGAKVEKEVMFTMAGKHCDLVENGVDEDIIIQGVIDLIINKGGQVYIVDFKTNKNFKDETLISTYSTQLNLYAKAYENAYGKNVNKLLLYSFSKNKFIEIPKKVLV